MKRLHVTMDDQLLGLCKSLAKYNGLSMSEYVRKLIIVDHVEECNGSNPNCCKNE